MTKTSVSYSKTGLLFLFFFSTSVTLATIFYNLDKALVIDFNLKRNPLGDLIWLSITNSAGVIGYGTTIVLLIASFFAKQRATKMKFYTVVLAGVISGLAVTSIKYGVHRVRPFHLFASIHPLGPGGGWSYPSGHTSDAFFLAVVIGLVYPNKKILVKVVYSWAIFVGISRVYLGVHYLSDVLAAVALGGASALCAFMMIQTLTRGELSEPVQNSKAMNESTDNRL